MKPVERVDELPTADAKRLDDLVRRYEQALQQPAASVVLQDFLPPPGDPLRRVSLAELIRSDLHARWQHGRPIHLERYLERFPEVGSARTVAAELIYDEYCARCRYDDAPRLDSYRGRFPDQFPLLQRLVAERPVPLPQRTPTAFPLPAQDCFLLTSGKGEILPVGGGYRLLERIGFGTYGEVWRAEAPGRVPIALKVLIRNLDTHESRRELEALELIRCLRHPYLLATQAYWALDQRLVIAMELAEGNLANRLAQCRQEGLHGVPVTELLAYFAEAAEAIDYLHGERVLHRDIKPANLLLLKRHAKVADFGLARLQESRQLSGGSICGTPAYMAPEVWRGALNGFSDQYSLAATYAELRLGRRLFAGSQVPQVIMQHLEVIPDLSPLGDAEQQALAQALAKEPDQRYPDCVQFVRALVEAVAKDEGRSLAVLSAFEALPELPPADELPAQSAAVQAAHPPRHWLRRTALTCAALVLAGLVLWQRQPRAEPLPPLCEPEHDARLIAVGDRWYHDRIARVLPEDRTRVGFVLVSKRSGTDDPETFYIMADKVSVRLFRKFAVAQPEAITDSTWEQGGLAGSNFTRNHNDLHPVLGVVVEDAQRFAQWLGGNLPTTQQWDRAAGRPLPGQTDRDVPEGPFRGPWDPHDRYAVAVNREREGPMEVGQAAQDVSPSGCRDMAGNGDEWTRDVQGRPDQKVPLADPGALDFVVLRGRSYLKQRPLFFKDLDKEPGSWFYQRSNPEIGFRVVLAASR